MTMPERGDDDDVNAHKIIERGSPWSLIRVPGRIAASPPVQFWPARVLLLYAALYLVGMLVGLAAKIVFDIQIRRPGSRQIVGLVILALLLWGAISITHTPFTDILLPLVWAGTGLLAGFGSREMHTVS
jgi:hypothetical protein